MLLKGSQLVDGLLSSRMHTQIRVATIEQVTTDTLASAL